MNDNERLVDKKYDGLTEFTIWMYGIGHVMNDLCAACWVNFLMYYIIYVQNLSTVTAGIVVLMLQISDGISTPLVGFYSDKFTSRFGKRMIWFIYGTVITSVTFFFTWQDCYPCDLLEGSSRVIAQGFWYSVFSFASGAAWSAVQIPHIALIPSLSPLKERKEKLIGLRSGFTYISNFAVLLAALIFFNFIENPKLQFSLLCAFILTAGAITDLLFIWNIKENKLTEETQSGYRELKIQNEDELGNNKKTELTWKEWLNKRELYLIAAVYTLARVSNNVPPGLLPFYLTTVLEMGGKDDAEGNYNKTPLQLASVPMVLYIGSVGTSFLLKKIGEKLSRKRQFQIGMIFIVGATIPLVFLTPDYQNLVFIIALFLGIGFSLQLNSSTGMVALFVGEYGSSGAFVWGAVSLVDKFSLGIAISILLNAGSLDSVNYMKFAMTVVPILASIIGTLIALNITKMQEYTKEGIIEE
ncbi:MFSD12_2 [Blepharisma stoltei]|uniref:Uncharacterized protein n=1 Tax=Blepharisma stoltei TaxID=1481888 RepID=A0AAU9IR52_9CILI|nr:unnamed protein product [Blepharisma stoltei]